ncbi:MAG TPA: glycosyltransferase family 39 protein [Rhodocyclaceae bacterium]
MKSRAVAWLLLIALFAAWFGTLGQRALVRPDEGRYAEIPREMVVSGDWTTPRLNDIKYFEKPALQYWATATAYTLFGEDEWTARLWPALTGFLGVLLAWYTGRRLWGERAGLLAGAILGSSLLYNVMAHVITLDTGLSFFLQLAWTGFIFAQQPNAQDGRRWMLIAWAALGLAMLSKGLVALVLTGGTLVTYSLLNRDLSPWKRLAPISGLALFLAISAPWFVAVSLANPEFPHFFFIHEHFERFLTKSHHRYQPNWYFLMIYAIGAVPWVFMLIHALAKSWRREGDTAFQPQRFLFVWVVLTFTFFSVSSSKLPPYILPIFPALALLGGRHLAELSRRALSLHLLAMLPVAIAGLIGIRQLAGYHDNDYSVEMIAGLTDWLTAMTLLWAAGLLGALALVQKRCNMAALTLLALLSFVADLGVLRGHDALAPFNSARDLAIKVRPLLTPGVPVYSVNGYEQTIPFYLKHTMTLVNYQDEMEFGLKQEPQKWIPTVPEFKKRWAADRDAFAAMSLSNYDSLKAEGLPMVELARDKRNVIVRKPLAP